MKSELIKQIKKIILSGVIAFLVLTLFCCVYYNVPVHSKNHNGATDYTWEPNVIYSSLTEGIGYGKTNNEGYMNIEDYNGQNIDVLIMGSSHLQGLAIPLKYNCSSLLSEMLEDKNVYNISIAGHNIKICLSNLDAALNRYKPKIVVIETSSLDLNDDVVNDILNNRIEEISSVENPIVNTLQHNQFLRLLYSQIKSFSANKSNEDDEKISSYTKIDDLMNHIKNITEKYNSKIVIIYHPVVSLSNDGKLLIKKDESMVNNFKNKCSENDIGFIDMSNRYIEEYNENYTLPTGFINTSISVGHLNVDGHRMFAEELYKVIREIR